MKIMSDAEAFGWKLTSILCFIIMVLVIVCSSDDKYDETVIPEVQTDTIMVHDTIAIHDTVYRWKEIKIEPEKSSEFDEEF